MHFGQSRHPYLKKPMLMCRFAKLFILMLAVPVAAMAQKTYPFFGCVTDDAGEALIGASILVEGTTKGTTTDVEGCFRLALTDSTATFVVSYAGFESQTTKALSGAALRVELSSRAALEEVVVIAATRRELRKASVVSGMSIHRERRTDSAPEAPAMSRDYISDDVSAYAATTPAKPRGGAAALPAAGQLTAGEINDFNKWDLWQDVRDEDLAAFQNTWQIYPRHRFSVQAVNEAGSPLPNAQVLLYAPDGALVWQGRTDNTGKAEAWAGLWQKEAQLDPSGYRLVVNWAGKAYPIEKPQPFAQGVNFIKIAAPCNERPLIDVAFAIDATGSMSDEIRYLQAELLDVMARVHDSLPLADLRLGSVFYRDHGDAYLTRHSDLNASLEKAMSFVRGQHADGGGDTPEAVDDALVTAVDSLNWRPAATTRLLFLVLDAPPHTQVQNIERLRQATERAAAAGIRIIPLTCSGIDKSTEYLMRSLALATNGAYSFLTNHSGIGNPHIEPSTDSYKVEKLNDLLVRVITGFARLAPCAPDEKPIAAGPDGKIIHPAPTDTTQHSLMAAWTFFPNPTRGPVTINIEGANPDSIANASDTWLYLADANGKLLERRPISSAQLHIDLSRYPAGWYQLVMNAGGPRSVGRVLRIQE